MQSWRDSRSDGVASQDRAKREASGQWFGYDGDIRLRGKPLISEIAAGAPEATLNFVGNKQRSMPGGESASALPESLRDRIDATFALNRLEDNRADTVVKSGFEVGNIVEGDEFHARNQRFKRRAVFFRGGNAERAEGASMKGILHGENARLGGRLAKCARSRSSAEPGQFESAFDGFGAAVCKKYAVETRPFRELARERTLEFVVKQI